MGFFKRSNNKSGETTEIDYSAYETVDLKKEIINRFLPMLESFEEEGIYAISFYVEHEDYDPRKPMVYFGYNTEKQVKNEIVNACEEEARWNYVYWLQNELYCFGSDDNTFDLCRAWVCQQRLSDNESSYLVFIDVLIAAVKELHHSGVIAKKIGKEIPILIHELEYYTRIAEQNVEANGEDLISPSFLHFCGIGQ